MCCLTEQLKIITFANTNWGQIVELFTMIVLNWCHIRNKLASLIAEKLILQ